MDKKILIDLPHLLDEGKFDSALVEVETKYFDTRGFEACRERKIGVEEYDLYVILGRGEKRAEEGEIMFGRNGGILQAQTFLRRNPEFEGKFLLYFSSYTQGFDSGVEKYFAEKGFSNRVYCMNANSSLEERVGVLKRTLGLIV